MSLTPKLKSIGFCFLVVLSLVVTNEIYGQETASNIGSTSESGHALKHMNDLANVAKEADPSGKTAGHLDPEIKSYIKKTTIPLINDPTLPSATRSAAKELQKSKTTYDVARITSQNPRLATTTPVAAYISYIQQALTKDLPAYSVTALSVGGMGGSPNGLSDIQGCKSISDAYPALSSTILDHKPTFRKLADSVGRIEVKTSSAQQPYVLRGTGFVIDHDRGLVATGVM